MSERPTILVVDDEKSMREFLSIYLGRQGHSVVLAESAEQALAQLAEHGGFDLVITDLKLPGASGLTVLEKVRALSPETPVIVMTAYATPETAVSAMKQGAYDYLLKPFKVDEIGLIVARALEKSRLVRHNKQLRQELAGQKGLGRLVGKSPAMERVYDLCRRVAGARANVLVLGESGTGKELVARAIHELSPRAKAPLVAINCAAIPETLLESELFGHVKGAFTGAVQDKPGLFETATGGTLFLDEIGELPLSLQVKLLRALQERFIKPVGGLREREVDVRVIAASNRNLEEAVTEGRFRQDLFYRLNVVSIRVPPLRERREDIPLLCEHFLRRFAAELGRSAPRITHRAMAALMSYAWPGNVRQLENVLERAITLESGEDLDLEAFPDIAGQRPQDTGLPTLPQEGFDLDATLAAIERGYIEKALTLSSGVRTEAARLLGITLRSLRYRIARLGIRVPGGSGDEPGAGDDPSHDDEDASPCPAGGSGSPPHCGPSHPT